MSKISLSIALIAFGLLFTARLFFTPHTQIIEKSNNSSSPLKIVKPSLNPVINISPGVALQKPRNSHTATRLRDGKILLVGGSEAIDQFIADVALFDPKKGRSGPGAPLHTPRHDHTATLLLDGRVLVVGGYTLPYQWLEDAEIYNPATDTWAIVPPLYSHGTAHTATLMKDGRVLVVGGCIGNLACTDRVEIFDPKTDSWKPAHILQSDRWGHTAQLLNNGLVLIAGGWKADGSLSAGGDALLYDPKNDDWIPTGPMIEPRAVAQSVRLINGRILVVGGIPRKEQGDPEIPTTHTELYDPVSNTWKAMPPLSQPRIFHTLVLLASGKVLAIGGARDWDSYWNNYSFVSGIEIFDPHSKHWEIIGNLPKPVAKATSTLLRNGLVWVTGGRNLSVVFSDTWLIRVK